jgi:hypothetical protein
MSHASSSLGISGAGGRTVIERIEPHSEVVSPRQRGGAVPPSTPNDKVNGGVRIFSPYRGGAQPPMTPSRSVNDSTMDRTDEDIQEMMGKTNHLAGLCFGTAVLFMGLSFYDGYRFLGERTASLILRGTFWAVVASVVGTAGEILQKTTKVETPIVPSTIYHAPATLKEGQFPGMPNLGNICFINAPTQAIMTDTHYPRVYKTLCERAKARHISFKNFLELYPAQSGLLSSFAWPKMLSRKREVEPPLAVVNTRDVLVVLMMGRSSINYNSPEFLRSYPTIHRLIGEFSRITRDADFPAVADDILELRQEFTLMKEDPHIMRFFDQERTRIANEILGFEAFLNLIQAYEAAVEQRLPVVSFGRWVSAPIGNIRHLINGAGGNSQEDVEEFLHCLSKYILPDDYPEVFFPLTYERVWEECPEAEQNAQKLDDLLRLHQNPRDASDLLTVMPDTKKIVPRPSAENILQIKSLLREGVSGQTLLDETFQTRRAPAGPDDPKQTFFYLDNAGRVRNYYLVSEKIVPPARMPERIILELIRYKWVDNEHGRRKEKIDCAVNMPAQINICGQPYGLKSVVLHTGLVDFGHYYTIVSQGDKCWYASDMTVDTAEAAHVQQTAKDGCLYFYAKINPVLE